MIVRGSCATRCGVSGAIWSAGGAGSQAVMIRTIARDARFMAADSNSCYRRASAAIEAEFVIIECTNCHARYQYDEDRFERKLSKKIKCAKCSNIFEIHNPAFAERPVAASVASGDSTLMRRDAAKKPPQATTEQSPLPKRED